MPVIRAQPGRAQHGGGTRSVQGGWGSPQNPPPHMALQGPASPCERGIGCRAGESPKAGRGGTPPARVRSPPQAKSPCRPRIPRADGTKSLTGPKALPSAPGLAARRGPAPRVPSGSPSSTQKELEKSQSLPGVGSPGRDGGACDAGAGAKAGLCAQALLPAHVPALLRPGQIPAAKMPPSFQFGLKRHLEELRFFLQAGGRRWGRGEQRQKFGIAPAWAA